MSAEERVETGRSARDDDVPSGTTCPAMSQDDETEHVSIPSNLERRPVVDSRGKNWCRVA